MPARTISVILPNYNRESLIGETLSNLLGQVLVPQWIVAVEDCDKLFGSVQHFVLVAKSHD